MDYSDRQYIQELIKRNEMTVDFHVAIPFVLSSSRLTVCSEPLLVQIDTDSSQGKRKTHHSSKDFALQNNLSDSHRLSRRLRCASLSYQL